MSRIRYLKPDFFKDEDLAELPHHVRLLFAGIWTIADREGRLEDRPKRIKAEIFPYEEIDIEALLVMLAAPKSSTGKPFILRYEVAGEKYIQIVKWHYHQKPHHTERKSVIPKITTNGEDKDKEKDKLAQTHIEVKERIKNGYLTVNSNTKSKETEDFDQLKAFEVLFAEYPSKIGRGEALRFFCQTVHSKEVLLRIHSSIKNYKKHLVSQKSSGFNKNPKDFNNWIPTWTDWENYVEQLTPEQKDAEIMARLKERK